MRYNGKCKVANLLGFNSNIRCIEILRIYFLLCLTHSLIVTLDVLKLVWMVRMDRGNKCLIVTLDVLKFDTADWAERLCTV